METVLRIVRWEQWNPILKSHEGHERTFPSIAEAEKFEREIYSDPNFAGFTARV